jgi:hypothetical protein
MNTIYSRFLNKTEEQIAGILWELLCINYDKETNFEYFIERARKMLREATSFKLQDQPLKNICIYQSEHPDLFVNMETTVVDNFDTIISLNPGSYEESTYDSEKPDENFYNDLEKALEGRNSNNIFGFAGAIGDRCPESFVDDACFVEEATGVKGEPEDENFYEELYDKLEAELEEIDADDEKFNAFIEKTGIDNHGRFGTSEAVFYYRQAFILRKKILESGLFNCDENFVVTCATHDGFEEVDKNLWKYIENTIEKPISEVFTEIGFL